MTIGDLLDRRADELPTQEAIVYACYPKVADVQVLGVPDTFFGEELLAVVLPKTGMQLTEQDLREYCTGRISHKKIPRYFQFVDAFPMTASGKVQKFVLREQAIKALGLEEVAKTKTA